MTAETKSLTANMMFVGSTQPGDSAPHVGHQLELAVTLRGRPCETRQVLRRLRSGGHEVLAYFPYRTTRGGSLLVITADAVHAQQTLERYGYTCEVHDVVMVTGGHIGLGALLGSQLHAGGVQMVYSYTANCRRYGWAQVYRPSDLLLAYQIIKASLELLTAELPLVPAPTSSAPETAEAIFPTASPSFAM